MLMVVTVLERIKRVNIVVDGTVERLKAKAYIKYAIVAGLSNSRVHPLVYEKALSLITEYKQKYSLLGIKNIYNVKLYREYMWKIGVDPTKIRPSHEALLRRCIRTSDFPRINTIVDIGNLVSLKYLVPVGIYDLGKIKPPLTLRTSVEGEVFYPIGSEIPRELAGGVPVVSDREKIIHLFPSRDSSLSSVDLSTRGVLVIVDGVEGIPLTISSSALGEVVEYLKKYTGNVDTVVRIGRVVWFGGI